MLDATSWRALDHVSVTKHSPFLRCSCLLKHRMGDIQDITLYHRCHSFHLGTNSVAQCADNPGKPELHLLHASSLKLASSRQLPHGCTAATISPNSCCIASIHQIGSPSSRADPMSAADDMHQPVTNNAHSQSTLTEQLQQSPPTYAASASGVPGTDTAHVRASTSEAQNDTYEASQGPRGIRAKQKRKREDLPLSTIICFHSLAQETLMQDTTLSDKASEGVLDAQTDMKPEPAGDETDQSAHVVKVRNWAS